jgi:hypothetical protein
MLLSLMPHSNEFASHLIVKRFAENDKIKEKLEAYKKPEFPDEARATGGLVERQQWQPKYVVAIDGSHHEVAFENGFPGAELGFVSLATVLIDVQLLISESDKPTIDPVIFSQVQSTYTLTEVLPSANMVSVDQPDARTSFRADWFNVLKNTKPADNAETLLDTYEALLKYKPSDSEQKCPLMELCPHTERPTPDYQTGFCNCGKYPVYPTDKLRIHERFTDTSSNGESMGEVMSTIEHLMLVAYLRYMERVCVDNDDWSLFEDTAIVKDGSLAVFGNPAWLSQAIKVELERINNVVRKAIGKDMLVFGIEKSGRFFDHWMRLDTKSRKDFEQEREDEEDDFLIMEPGRINKNSVLLLDNAYIRKYIVPSPTDSIHGKYTYYGRPFLYKTATGALIVGISAILSAEQNDRSTAELKQFPRLADTLDLLDLLVSVRYPNAVIPLIAAHAEAAIPMQMGERVLDRLAREHVGKSRS